LRFASTDIRQDFHVVVRAVANHKSTLALCTGGIHPATFQVQVQEKMQLQKTFLNDFLRGITIICPVVPVVPAPVPPARRQLSSHLPKLDLGDETSQAFKQLIAEYLGVPVGSELTLLRKCWTNLNSTTPTTTTTTATPPTAPTIRDRLLARERPRLDWLAHGPHPPPNIDNPRDQHPQHRRVEWLVAGPPPNPREQQQGDGGAAHAHPAWNNMQRLAHYRNRRMQRLHVMGGRGRVVFLHGQNGNPNNNQNIRANNPFDIVDLEHGHAHNPDYLPIDCGIFWKRKNLLIVTWLKTWMTILTLTTMIWKWNSCSKHLLSFRRLGGVVYQPNMKLNRSD
jgi:hypothetical protein